MSIGHYLKEIGRGKDGARALSREQAADLFGQVLDGSVTDLPKEIDADSTATYIRRVMAGDAPVPPPIAQQVAHIVWLAGQLSFVR